MDPFAPRRRLTRRAVQPAIAIGLTCALAAWLITSGTLSDTAATLVVMGFSPDRANLLAGLLLTAFVVAGGTLAFDAPRSAGIVAAIAFVAFYGSTFVTETQAAVEASGATEAFDPVGWTITLLTLAFAILVTGWSAAILAGVGRQRLIGGLREIRRLGAGDRSGARTGVRSLAVVTALLAGLVVCLPTLGDMLNYEPDVHMRTGSALGVGLASGASQAPGLPGAGSGPSSTIGPATGEPWLAWQPSGTGTIDRFDVPSPWAGSPSSVQLVVYVPPGYATGSERYPVLYEVPFSFLSWATSVQLPNQMDTLIDSGAIPAQLVVFVFEHGGPYPDSECANSVDGREWFESWIVSTVVPAIDTRYRTIKEAAARALLGYSQGGFCASMLTLRHPDVFGSAISFSGYFLAGIRSNQTVNAWRPYGGIAPIEAAASPDDLAGQIPGSLRSKLFFELSVNPAEGFYGPQSMAFASALGAASIPYALFQTPFGHAWAACRSQLAPMLEALGARQAALHVFSA